MENRGYYIMTILKRVEKVLEKIISMSDDGALSQLRWEYILSAQGAQMSSASRHFLYINPTYSGEIF